jgi:hypothetical protein
MAAMATMMSGATTNGRNMSEVWHSVWAWSMQGSLRLVFWRVIYGGEMEEGTETKDDFNYFIVRWMINLAALGLSAGLVALIVFCALTID